MPKKSVAIVGSHPVSREGVPYDREYVDIWVFNEAASLGWPKRITAAFQMHKPPIWKNPNNLNDKNYPQWLQAKHDFPIFMIEKFAEVPSSEKYPLDDVVKALLPNFVRGRKDRSQIRTVFSSTIAYSIALAIYKGYEQIMLYGVEMDSNTEYMYQRSDVYFWIGVAVGRGIDVIINEKSKTFDGLLYGFEGDIVITDVLVEERKAKLLAEVVKAEAEMAAANDEQEKALKLASSDDTKAVSLYFTSVKAQAQAAIKLGMMHGALSEDERYLAKAADMNTAAEANAFSRQEFERTAAVAQQKVEELQASMSVAGGKAAAFWKQLSSASPEGVNEAVAEAAASLYLQAHGEYIDAAFEYGKMFGVVQENLVFLSRIDELIKAAGGKKAELAFAAANKGGTK